MTTPTVAVCLGIVNVIVVCGNVAVLYILISQKSLHTPTNFIVLSLTLSDFLLGVCILPFSILQEYNDSWVFSEIWCKSWLALDVFFSTASIYNLLAISFDRYMAVRQPIKYRFISSTRMTRITIAIVWLISLLLSIPPFIYESFGHSSLPAMPSAGSYSCTPMASNNLYIIFSALVSFILPMFLMVGLNISIFHTVSDSTKLSQPSRSRTSTVTSNDEMNSIMRIHRGRATSAISTNARGSTTMTSIKTISTVTSERPLSRPLAKYSLPSTRKHTLHEAVLTGNLERCDTLSIGSLESPQLTEETKDWISRLKTAQIARQHLVVEMESDSSTGFLPSRSGSVIRKTADVGVWYPAVVTSLLPGKRSKKYSERLLLYPILQLNRISLRTEVRVARTIGIVVGAFTICWLPFAIIYLLQAFQACPVGICIPNWLFTLAFWLGYANSAVNPLLYAAFSRDFRSAFRRVFSERSTSFRSF